ncbi:MAG: hypothetical protein AAGH90_04925 [Pseudomonadota bacterium]
MLVEVLDRVPDHIEGIDVSAPIVSANEAHVGLARGAMMVSDHSDGWVLAEPDDKDSAPSIALGAHFAIHQEGEDALLLILSGRGEIGSVTAFHASIEQGVKLARDGTCVRFYAGAEESGAKETGSLLVPAKTLLEALATERPDMANLSRSAWDQRRQGGKRVFIPNTEAWTSIRSEPFEEALHDLSSNSSKVFMNTDWRPVETLADLAIGGEIDAFDNSISGRAVMEQSRDNLILSQSGRTITVLGCESLVIIDTDDAVLVVPKEKANDIAMLHAHLKAIGRDDLL